MKSVFDVENCKLGKGKASAPVETPVVKPVSGNKPIIFPYLVKPENDTNGKWKSYYWAAAKGANQAAFNSNRGARKHAGRDLYSVPFTTVVAICDGVVLSAVDFYAQTHEVTISHTTNDGRKFIIRYGELDPRSLKVKTGDQVTQGQILGKTGKLLRGDGSALLRIGGTIVYMLHFEHYTGASGLNINSSLTQRGNPPFQRRADLTDSIKILQEGYKNTF